VQVKITQNKIIL